MAGRTETSNTLVFQLEKHLDEVKAEYQRLMSEDVPAYDRAIAGSRIAPAGGPFGLRK